MTRVITSEMIEQQNRELEAALQRLMQTIEEVSRFGQLTEAEAKVVAYWRPSETNQTCECAGNYVCAPHALVKIIDRLTGEDLLHVDL